MALYLKIDDIVVNKNGFKKSKCKTFEPNDEFTKEDLTRIDKIRTFIKQSMEVTYGISVGSTSYGLKHDCERAIGEYVSNGEFIYAMYLEDFRIEREREKSPNARFNYHYPKYKKQIIKLYPDLARQYRWISS